MRRFVLLSCFLLAGCLGPDAPTCDSDPGCGGPGDLAELPERGGDAADDVPGCEVVVAFAANPLVAEGRPAWWAVDFSACGPAPAPRMLRWVTLGGYVATQTVEPVADECAVVEIEAEEVAVSGWRLEIWRLDGGLPDGSSTPVTYGPQVGAGPDYSPDSAIVCGLKQGGDELLWDCTGLPWQEPSCSPITGG